MSLPRFWPTTASGCSIFLDFSAKYPLPDSPSDKVKLFADKLRSKNQTAGQVDTRVQEAFGEAVRKAKLMKRVTSHTLRHCYATHLLQAGYDLRTIQTLLGHADVRTMMIYTHCVLSKTLKEMKSPLDF